MGNKVTKKYSLLYIIFNKTHHISNLTSVLYNLAEFGIDTSLRMAHFLAQVARESGELGYTEEIASGQAYKGRKGLGNTHPGDGRRYKGRGLIQITGRNNYERYKAYCGFDVVQKPALLSQPLGSTRSAYWRR